MQFFSTEVQIFEHVIQKDGVYPSKDKEEAVLEAPRPKDLKELYAFNGLVTNVHKFIPNLSAKSGPILKLLKKHQPFSWGLEQLASLKLMNEGVLSGQFLVADFEDARSTYNQAGQNLAALVRDKGKDSHEQLARPSHAENKLMELEET